MDKIKKVNKISKILLMTSIVLAIALYLLIKYDNSNIYFVLFDILVPILVIISLIGFIYSDYMKASLTSIKFIYYISTFLYIFGFLYVVYNNIIGIGHLIFLAFGFSILTLLGLTILANKLKKLKHIKNEWMILSFCVLIIIILYLYQN